MKKEQLNTFKIRKCISKGIVADVYELSDGRFLKVYSSDFINLYLLNGISIENKITDSVNIRNVSEIILPYTIVYNDDIFCGYTCNRAKGLSYVDYMLSLPMSSHLDLKNYATIYANIESTVERGWESNLVFPDLMTGKNTFIDENGNIQLIDFDGIQYMDYPADSVSSSVKCPQIYTSKFLDGDLWTKELDKKSLVQLYFAITFRVSLAKVGLPTFDHVVTLQEIFDSICLDEPDIYDKVSASLSTDRKGILLQDDVWKINSKYNLVMVPFQGSYIKRLVRK